MRFNRGNQGRIGYETAQVCLNGHVITQFVESHPEETKKFCDKCGEATTSVCPKCSKPVHGFYHHPRVGHSITKAPAFCHECGSAYPWTERQFAATKELANEIFTPEESIQVQQSLENIVRETPNTPVAIVRFKKLMSKAGQTVASGFRDILVDVVSEAIKKQIWP